MWVEKRKRRRRKKKGAVPRTERSPMMCKKNMTKKRWVDRSRDFFDFNVPSTTQGHLRTLVKIYVKKKKKKRPKRNTGKKERIITEVKRALQSTKENRTPKEEKRSGTQSKKRKKGEKTNKTKTS